MTTTTEAAHSRLRSILGDDFSPGVAVLELADEFSLEEMNQRIKQRQPETAGDGSGCGFGPVSPCISGSDIKCVCTTPDPGPACI